MRPGIVGIVGAFALLATRGLLLWVVVPIGFLVWVVSAQGFRTPPVSLGAFLGWIDNNVVFVLQRGPFRMSFPQSPVRWVPAKGRAAVRHRVGFTDPL